MPRVTAKLGPHGWLVCNCRLYLPRPVGASGSNAHGVFDSLQEPPLTADIPENPVLDQDARRSTAVTCTGVQTPPRAVAMPRAFRALAMPRNDVAPLALSAR